MNEGTIRQPDQRAVYEAVCERYRQWYGAEHMKRGACLYWSLTLAGVLNALGHRALLQAGSLSWSILPPEQDDGKRPTHFAYEWSPWREESRAALRLGLLPEIHVWVGLPATNGLVDFSTKFLPELAAREGLQWRTAPPPDFLWCRPDELPSGVAYQPNREAITFILDRLRKQPRPLNR
jgi:hypothetical protein